LGSREELVSGRYVLKPLLRVWIPKSNGGQRPLGIPCISDRVVQMAAVLIIGPIFEADLLPQQYGFRPGLDAKMALRRVYWHVPRHRFPCSMSRHRHRWSGVRAR
jgi:RNA-directed DNA polymerase